LDLAALMLDGVHFGEHVCVVALGIGIDGIKHPLGLVEGDTENTTVVTDLLVGLRDRGLDTTARLNGLRAQSRCRSWKKVDGEVVDVERIHSSTPTLTVCCSCPALMSAGARARSTRPRPTPDDR
jgi:hypothetical protein